jgi:hypothetical protein
LNLPSRIDTQFFRPFWNIAFTNPPPHRVCTAKKRTYFVIGHATFSPHQATFLRLEYLRKFVYNQNHKVTRQHETASLSAPHTAPTGRVSLWPCEFLARFLLVSHSASQPYYNLFPALPRLAGFISPYYLQVFASKRS